MKKKSNTKLVALLTAFLMVFAMMPFVAYGEDDPKGTRATHTHDNMTFTEWTETSSLPNTSGNYCLTNDVTIGSTWEVPNGTTTLCLNGHGIKFTGETGSVINIGSGKTLNIMDCNSENLTHKYKVVKRLAIVDDDATGEGVETFSGGYITGGKGAGDNSGTHGGCLYNSGTFNMTGGTIIGNTADYGGGIENRGKFTVNGNALIAYNIGLFSGGIFNVPDKEVTMSGNAAILNNYAAASSAGAGVANLGKFYISGSPVISGNICKSTIASDFFIDKLIDDYGIITVTGELTEGALIGVRHTGGNGIIAVPGTSYTITDSDKARFFADPDDREVNLITEGDDAGKLELKDKEYDLWVGGTRVTYANRNNIPATNGTQSGTASFDPETDTLTLDNYNYTGPGYAMFKQDYAGSIVWYCDEKLTILLKGTSTLTTKEDGYSAGIYVIGGSLEIKNDPAGDGSDRLNVNAGPDTEEKPVQTKAIAVCGQNMTISGGIVNAFASGAKYNSMGVYREHYLDITINGGSLSASAGECTESPKLSWGIHGDLIIDEDAEVTASGHLKAIDGKVQNAVYGDAWKNVAGTGDPDTIMPVTDPTELPSENGTYKKVVFPGTKHAHSFTYAAGEADEANTITATCTREMGCPDDYDTTPLMITLNVPSDVTYDGTPKVATITGYPETAVTGLADEPDIVYFKSEGAGSTTISGDQLTGEPVNAGDYVAQIEWGDATASAPFSIAKAPLTITALDQTYEYNGKDQGPGDEIYESEFENYVITEGLIGDDALTKIELSGQAKAVGVYEGDEGITVSAAEVDKLNEEDGNYVITYVPGKLIITAEKQPDVSGTPLTEVTAKGNTALTIGWLKVNGAAGYDIFFAQCDHNGKKTFCKNAKTIKGNNTFKWTKSGLKKGTAYKAYVKAYVMKDGKKKYVKTSPLMHAYTGNGNKKFTNAKSISVNKAKVTLKKGKTFKIKAKVKKVKKSKKLMPKSHVATLRYETSDSKVATVSKGGKIKARGKGACEVYVFAHNGVHKTIKVTVK